MKICKKRSKSFIFSNLLWGNLCLGFFEALLWAHQRAPGSQDSACGGYSRDAPIDSEESPVQSSHFPGRGLQSNGQKPAACLPAKKHTLQRPEWSDMRMSVVWLRGRMMPSSR